MTHFTLSPDDRARVTAAVTQAEHGTDGEIVTIVTERSDTYADIALHYAVFAMLLVVAVASIFPHWLTWWSDGWSAPDPRHTLLALMVVEVLVYLAAYLMFAWMPLRLALTPRVVRRHRVRRRAIRYFKVGAEQRTAARVGILLYLSADEHMAEIVADEAIHRVVGPEAWGDAMVALVAEVRERRVANGMVAAVEQIGAVLATHFPKTADDVNELPDRLIEL